MTKTRLILLRHGITASNLKGIFLGKTDVELSFMGEQQAKSASKWIYQHEKIDVIYSSKLKRAISTAKSLQYLTNSEMYLSEGLNEMDFGDWEGKKHGDIFSSYPEEYIIWETLPHLHSIPRAERIIDISKRLTQSMEEILNLHRGKNICIVTHGVCIKALMAFFRGYDISEMNKVAWHGNASISIIDYRNDSFEIERENFTGYLSDDLKLNFYPDIEEIILRNESKNNKISV